MPEGRECCESDDYSPPGVKIVAPKNGDTENPGAWMNVEVDVWGSCKIVKYVIRYSYPKDDTLTRAEDTSLDPTTSGGQVLKGKIPKPPGGEWDSGKLKIHVDVADICGNTEYDEATITISTD